MVISLFDQCRLEIRNGIETGAEWVTKIVPRLSPQLRQSILDMVLMHGTVNNPNCLAILGSMEFLDGITSLNTQSGNSDDHRYLDRVAATLASTRPNGEKLGTSISELQLNIYRCIRAEKDVEEKEASLLSVIRLIARCPNLAVLKIRLVEKVNRKEPDEEHGEMVFPIRVGIFGLGSSGPGLLNKTKLMEPCASIMENLSELWVVGHRTRLLRSELPILRFKRLATLHLVDVFFDTAPFHQILIDVHATLATIYLKGVDISEDSNYGPYVLPFWLPNLKALTVKDGGFWIRLYRPFLDTLLKCPRLEHVDLDMIVEKEMEDEACLQDLNRLRATVDVSLYLHYYRGVRPIFRGSRFRFIDLFGKKIKFFELNTMDEHWDQRFNTAVEHFVRTCNNLTCLRLLTPTEKKISAKGRQELATGKLALAPLFADRVRAAKLTYLSFIGAYDPSVLKLIFENCINVSSFSTWDCPQLTDDHFIEWARRGVKMETIIVERSPGISDDGLIPLLKNSGSKLHYCLLRPPKPGPCRITNCTWVALIEHCRYVKQANSPVELRELALQKCFNKVEDVKTAGYE